MAVWELALLLIGVTVFVANMGNLFITLAMVRKYGPVFDKSVKILDKMMDKSEKVIDEMFDQE